MLEEEKRLRERLQVLKAEHRIKELNIAEVEKRLLAYDLAEGRGNQ